jgi:hypothetical protein
MSDEAFLTFKELKRRKRWPFTPQYTNKLVRAGKFPRPFKAIEGGRVSLWRESDIDAYMAQRSREAGK